MKCHTEQKADYYESNKRMFLRTIERIVEADDADAVIMKKVSEAVCSFLLDNPKEPS